MPVLSAVIITKNEERNIARCLSSLKEIADEIIIIDSQSTDRTEEICKTFGTRFITTEWKGYAATKNYGNSKATGDYILSIDADEALSEELLKAIKLFKTSDNKAEAYQFNRLTSFCGRWIKHCGWYPDKKVRLWKRGLVKWEGLVHEIPAIPTGVKIQHLHGNLLHYSYYTINEYIDQTKKYTDLSARANFERGKNYGMLKLLFAPPLKFFSCYIIKGGFLDGFYGLVISLLSSMASFLKYAKTRQLFIENVSD